MRLAGCLVFFLALPIMAATRVPQVKVLIGKSLKDVVVHGMDLRQEIPSQRIERTFKGKQTVNFNCRLSSKVVLPSRPLLVASVSSPTGLVGWENRRYKGELHLVAGAEAGVRGCDLVNLVPMETYISSLLAKEMRADWPVEALKAQAVAARSYALSKMSEGNGQQSLPWHLESSEKNQVSGSFFDTNANTDRAAHGTAGEILVDAAGQPVAGFFHSKCGGRTMRPDQVWSGSVDGYQGVDCPFCHKHGRKLWGQRVSKSTFSGMLAQALTKHKEVAPSFRPEALTFVHDTASNSDLRVYSGNQQHVVRKAWLRNLLGREQLPSNHFRILDQGTHVSIEGTGYGHGVGLCQMGAFELAKRGYGYREILQHYFPGLQVKKGW